LFNQLHLLRRSSLSRTKIGGSKRDDIRLRLARRKLPHIQRIPRAKKTAARGNPGPKKRNKLGSPKCRTKTASAQDATLPSIPQATRRTPAALLARSPTGHAYRGAPQAATRPRHNRSVRRRLPSLARNKPRVVDTTGRPRRTRRENRPTAPVTRTRRYELRAFFFFFFLFLRRGAGRPRRRGRGRRILVGAAGGRPEARKAESAVAPVTRRPVQQGPLWRNRGRCGGSAWRGVVLVLVLVPRAGLLVFWGLPSSGTGDCARVALTTEIWHDEKGEVPKWTRVN